MNEDILQPVLTEILEEQRTLLEQSEKQGASLQQLCFKLDALEGRLKEQALLPAADTTACEQSLKKGIEEVKEIVEGQAKTVVHQKRILLFPEGKAEQYYHLIFGGLFKGIVILILGVFALTVLNRYIREKEYLHYKSAWQLLYSMQKED